MKNLIQINFQNIKNVGIRVDFNVPITDSFQITDNTRLIRAKDTIDFVFKNESKILLLSHYGRPKESFEEKFSFKKQLCPRCPKVLPTKIITLFRSLSL